MHSITGPKQAAIITCRGSAKIMGKDTESDNLSCIHRHMLSSTNPPLYTIAVKKNRFTVPLIQNSGVFCVNFVDEQMHSTVLKGKELPGDFNDKFIQLMLDKEECSHIDCPRLTEAASYIECELIDQKDNGDSILFHGKIVNGRILKKSKRLMNINRDHYEHL